MLTNFNFNLLHSHINSIISFTVSPQPEKSSDPSTAQAAPGAIALAGPGGVAGAAPKATALAGKGGLAISSPQATAVAGTQQNTKRPGNKDKTK